MLRTDTALDVTGIARRAADLGRNCTIIRIDGALHDVILSAPDVRAVAYAKIARWMSRVHHIGRRRLGSAPLVRVTS